MVVSWLEEAGRSVRRCRLLRLTGRLLGRGCTSWPGTGQVEMDGLGKKAVKVAVKSVTGFMTSFPTFHC